jgi:hypothetical protein
MCREKVVLKDAPKSKLISPELLKLVEGLLPLANL